VIRVLLADDENVIRSALAQMLDLEDDIQVVAEAADGTDALAAARASRPDVRYSTSSCQTRSVSRWRRRSPALASGRRGLLPETTSAATLSQVVRIGHSGGRLVDPELTAEAIAAGDSPLTPREARSARGCRRWCPR